MTDARYLVRYDTSLLGRCTFVIFLAASLSGVAFVAVPMALLAMQAGGHEALLIVAGALLIALVCAGLAMMSGLRAFGPGQRLSLTNDGFKYDGLFKVLRVRWNRVESFQLTQGDFIVRLKVKVKPDSGSTQTLSLDVGGLSASPKEIQRAFGEATGLRVETTQPKKPEKAENAEPAGKQKAKAEAA